ncbi:MAG: hypothetical protein M3162_09740, partial [Thermoproteota archaeon]|nr:hypothetical protein [Thermoproteota archaeon]
DKPQDTPILADAQDSENHSNLYSKSKGNAMNLKDSMSRSKNLPFSQMNGLRKTAAEPPPASGGSNVLPFLSIVERTIDERPHLKQEDRQVLRFIAEKGGTAFESEIRNKFILPKTTLWRLVRRLERENLVKVRKTGVQNLIELRYSPSEDNNNDQND